MDQILNIFRRLEIDSTVLIQFALLVGIFLIANKLLFSKLLEVLKKREDQTTGLEHIANKKFAEADALGRTYKDRIDAFFNQKLDEIKARKRELNKGNKEELEKYVQKTQKEYENNFANFSTEISMSRDKIFSQKNELSSELVNKLTN